MKTLISTLVLLFGIQAAAETVEVPVKFEVITVSAACKTNCRTDQNTGVQSCRHNIFFEKDSFDFINDFKKAEGLSKNWFKKSPKEICEAGELPVFGQGFKNIDMLLYRVDLSSLSEQL